MLFSWESEEKKILSSTTAEFIFSVDQLTVSINNKATLEYNSARRDRYPWWPLTDDIKHDPIETHFPRHNRILLRESSFSWLMDFYEEKLDLFNLESFRI